MTKGAKFNLPKREPGFVKLSDTLYKILDRTGAFEAATDWFGRGVGRIASFDHNTTYPRIMSFQPGMAHGNIAVPDVNLCAAQLKELQKLLEE